MVLAVMLTMGVMALPVLAEDTTEEAAPSVIIWAEDMKDKISGLQPVSTFSFTEEKGFTVLNLGIKAGVTGGDPYAGLTFDTTYSTDTYKYITVLVKSNTIATFSIFYGTEGTGGSFVGGGRVATNYANTNDWQFLSFDFSGSEKWTGELSKIRFDYFEGGDFNEKNSCQILAVILSSSIETAYDAAYDAACKLYPPVQSFSDFTTEDLDSIGRETAKTTVSVGNGNLFYIPNGDYRDPSAWFYYDKLTAARGVKALTTEDFRYTVIRYRSSMNLLSPKMQLFVLTGDAKNLFDMITTEGTYNCHYGTASYVPSKTYKAAMVDLAQTDGQAKNDRLLNGWQGRGKVSGFRFDWCEAGTPGAHLEVSDFMFYADKAAADGMTALINTMSLTDPDDIKDWEDTYETEHVVMPWETESDNSTEETVPDFPEDTTEETSEVEPGSDDETGSEVIETGSEIGTEIETENETEQSTAPGQSGGNPGNMGGPVGDIEISGGDEPPVDQGSQTPFLIACIALACLSIASIVTVLVIRAKEKQAVRA